MDVVLCEGQVVALGAASEGVPLPLPLPLSDGLSMALPEDNPEVVAQRLREGGKMKVPVAQRETAAGAVPEGGPAVGVSVGAGVKEGGSAQLPLSDSHRLPPTQCAGR